MPSAFSNELSPVTGLSERDTALLALLAELPSCSPSQVISTAADMLKSRSSTSLSGTDALRVSQSVGLRFMLVYVRHAQPLRALGESWSKLSTLIRSALPGNEPNSALILVRAVWGSNPLDDTRRAHVRHARASRRRMSLSPPSPPLPSPLLR